MKVKPRAEVEAAWRAYEGRDEKPAPELANLTPALYLTGPLRVPFRGRMWTAHVSFDDGVEAVDIAQRINRARKSEDMPGVIEAVRDAKYLADRILRRYPERWWHKLGRVTGLRRSPVRDWTEKEVGELVGFFLMCRTTSRVGGSTGPAPSETWTYSTSSRSSFEPSPHGAGRTASP